MAVINEERLARLRHAKEDGTLVEALRDYVRAGLGEWADIVMAEPDFMAAVDRCADRLLEYAAALRLVDFNLPSTQALVAAATAYANAITEIRALIPKAIEAHMLKR